MQNDKLAKLILTSRRYQNVLLFLLFVNIVVLAVLYCRYVSPALMPDKPTNPAFVEFMASTAYQQLIVPHFVALKTYNEAPNQHSRPNATLLATDPSQFGVIVDVQYSLQQHEASSDGVPRYRYDTHIRVRPSFDSLAKFAGVEIVLTGLLVWGLRAKRDPLQDEFEALVLRGYYFPEESETANTPAAHEALLRLLSRFHVYAKELQAQPRAGHSAWKITDEYDVQHALCALLRTHFDNVKSEETTPSHAGSSSRVDFLLVNERMGVEAKMMRDSLSERKLGEQLLLDVVHFPRHPQCESLIFLIYDPAHMIRSPVSLRIEIIEAARGFPIDVLYSPPR